MSAWYSFLARRKAQAEVGLPRRATPHAEAGSPRDATPDGEAGPPCDSTPDAEARLGALEVLLRVAEPSALAEIVTALADPDGRVRDAAIRGLEHPETPAFEAMLDTVRAETAVAAVAAGDGAAPEARPRIYALAATLGAEEGADRLIALLSEGDKPLRHAAIAALSSPLRHAPPPTRQRLVLAARPLLGDDDGEIQLDAAIVLAVDADDSRARNLLLELAHAATAAAEGVLSGASAEVSRGLRLAAIRALGRLPDAATRAVLLATLRDLDGEVRGAACDALSDSGDARTADVLTRLETSDADPDVRRRAQAAALAIRARRGR